MLIKNRLLVHGKLLSCLSFSNLVNGGGKSPLFIRSRVPGKPNIMTFSLSRACTSSIPSGPPDSLTNSRICSKACSKVPIYVGNNRYMYACSGMPQAKKKKRSQPRRTTATTQTQSQTCPKALASSFLEDGLFFSYQIVWY